MQRRHWLRAVFSAGASVGLPAWSQPRSALAWPTKPLRLVVPFPAGSSPDIVARWVAEPLGQALGVAVVIDNRPGAGGNIGTASVAHAVPDGRTWLFTIQGPLVTSPMLTAHLGYDPQRDLAPVALVATSPNVLVVDARTGLRDVAGFVREAKAQAGRWNYGSVGIGSAAHLAMEAFKRRAGLSLAHIPYAGFPQVVQAMLAGDIQAAFMVPGIAMGAVDAGRLHALAVTSLGRSASLPALPTLVESGFPGFEAISWQGVLAPAGTLQDLIRRMSAELVRILRSDTLRTRLRGMHFSAAGTAPEALARLMADERVRWGEVIRAAGLRPQ